MNETELYEELVKIGSMLDNCVSNYDGEKIEEIAENKLDKARNEIYACIEILKRT